MSNWLKRLKERAKDNKGSALVLAIIAIVFVGALVAMLVYMVYFNFLMKYTDRAAKQNFYTAETAVDIIKAGLEQDVSEAMVFSYYDVVNNHTDDSALNKQAAFEETFKNQLTSTIMNVTTVTAGDPGAMQTFDVYDPARLADYWNRITRIGDTTFEDFVIYNPGTINYGARMELGAVDSSTNPTGWDYGTSAGVTDIKNNGPVVTYNGSVITFHNVKVSYTNPDGYVSMINTDITLETPKINFANVLSLPELEKYALVASGGVYDGYTRDVATFKPVQSGGGTGVTVTGSVNAGEDGLHVSGISGEMVFKKKDTDPDTTVNTLVASVVSAEDGRDQTSSTSPSSTDSISVDDSYEIWAGDIVADTASMTLAGNCFVQDDLTTLGTYPKVVLSNNKYVGYGSEASGSKNSSAILINGAYSTLDFSTLKSLELAGSAYVGSTRYDANKINKTEDDLINGSVSEYLDEKATAIKAIEDAGGTNDTDVVEGSEVDNTNNDVVLGQSLAVKADQLMYMVPTECMVYEGSSQILAKNPLTYHEYVKYSTATTGSGTSERPKYDMVNLNAIMEDLGNNTSINDYGASFVPVFRRVNGDILVYYYIKFATADRANDFFRDYYAADRDSFVEYFNSYVRSFTINPAITANNSAYLHIAGNMLYKSGSALYMKEDTYEEDLANFDTLNSARSTYSGWYQTQLKYLMKTTTDQVSASVLSGDVFGNIAVSDSNFAQIVPSGTYSVYKNDAGEEVAIVVNNKNKGVFHFGGSNTDTGSHDLSNIHLIIATGDVELNVDEYNGLIFSGGDIYIGATTVINSDYAEVPKAMIAKNSAGNYAFEVIQNGIAYANSMGTTDAELLAAIERQRESDIVRASDLVKYVNWTKE
ncbi:MAG: hypothetical protein K6G07_05035 [Lachnospiraceae bacterium]|nr:hypothetical protein [Lachnospiraceae bacterium]